MFQSKVQDITGKEMSALCKPINYYGSHGENVMKQTGTCPYCIRFP